MLSPLFSQFNVWTPYKCSFLFHFTMPFNCSFFIETPKVRNEEQHEFIRTLLVVNSTRIYFSRFEQNVKSYTHTRWAKRPDNWLVVGVLHIWLLQFDNSVDRKRDALPRNIIFEDQCSSKTILSSSLYINVIRWSVTLPLLFPCPLRWSTIALCLKTETILGVQTFLQTGNINFNNQRRW